MAAPLSSSPGSKARSQSPDVETRRTPERRRASSMSDIRNISQPNSNAAPIMDRHMPSSSSSRSKRSMSTISHVAALNEAAPALPISPKRQALRQKSSGTFNSTKRLGHHSTLVWKSLFSRRKLNSYKRILALAPLNTAQTGSLLQTWTSRCSHKLSRDDEPYNQELTKEVGDLRERQLKSSHFKATVERHAS